MRGCSLRLRQRGRVTQATCNQVRRRLFCSRRCAYFPLLLCERHKQNVPYLHVDSRREARQAGQSVGVLSHPMPSSHYYCIPSHHISRRHAREGISRLFFYLHPPYLYTSAILGHAPPPALPCPAPACLNFPYLLPIAQAQFAPHSLQLSPDLRHGAS
jgi:hypothetical protein